MLRNRALVATSVALLALAGGACGGDDDDDGGGGASDVTKEEFIENADAVCADVSAQIEEIGNDVSDEASLEEVTELLQDEVLPLFRDQIEQLRGLDLPADDADELEQMFDDLEAATDDVEQQLEDDPEAALSEDSDPFAEVNASAREYGLEECGSG